MLKKMQIHTPPLLLQTNKTDNTFFRPKYISALFCNKLEKKWGVSTCSFQLLYLKCRKNILLLSVPVWTCCTCYSGGAFHTSMSDVSALKQPDCVVGNKQVGGTPTYFLLLCLPYRRRNVHITTSHVLC